MSYLPVLNFTRGKSMDLKRALESLDPATDDLWTSDGLPRVDAVSAILGYETSRSEITDADPMLSRSSAPTPVETQAEDLADEPVVETDREVVVPIESDAKPIKVSRKMTDADQAAYVEIIDDVVGMSPTQVFADLELTQRASDEFARQSMILMARREAITEKIKDVGQRSALIDTALSRHSRGKIGKSQSNIRNYLDQQKKNREKRALKAQKFLDAGTNAEDVADVLRGSSKLDQSLKARKRQTPA